jgi:protein-S-isoprenylcysteine O-methyltransferase Ste14
MIPFSAIFSTDFFFNLGYVILSVAGLVCAASFRRSQAGKTSLFLLLTAALVATYYTLQWLLASFISYFVSNYAAAHSDFQMPSWVNLTLVILFTALNYGFVIGLALTAWSAVRKTRADRAVVAATAQKVCSAAPETCESSEVPELPVSEVVTAEPPVPGPEG